MSRYIDMSNYKDLLNEEYLKTMKLIELGESYLDNLAEGFTEADHVIARMPTADVKPVVRGEWIDGTDVFCSHCGEKALRDYCYDVQIYSDFCPHCGADMIGDEK